MIATVRLPFHLLVPLGRVLAWEAVEAVEGQVCTGRAEMVVTVASERLALPEPQQAPILELEAAVVVVDPARQTWAVQVEPVVAVRS